MKLYKLKKYKLSATVIRSADEIWLSGTFGPFGFEAIAHECEECHCFIRKSIEIWPLKLPKGPKAFDNAMAAIEDRLARAQVPQLREKEEKRITL